MFRGISVKENEVGSIKADLLSNGISKLSNSQIYTLPYLPLELHTNYLKEEIEIKTIPTFENICFADKCGAEYYALKRNSLSENKIGLIIQAELDLKQLSIDGRDFLYYIFEKLKYGKEPVSYTHLTLPTKA